MMRHTGDTEHLQLHNTSDELIYYRLRLFNLIIDIFKIIIPNNKFFYDWEEHGVKQNPQKRRQIFLDSLLLEYDHDKR